MRQNNQGALKVTEARACTHRFEGVGFVPVVLAVVYGIERADDEGPGWDGVWPKPQVALAHPGGAGGCHRLQPHGLLERAITLVRVNKAGWHRGMPGGVGWGTGFGLSSSAIPLFEAAAGLTAIFS